MIRSAWKVSTGLFLLLAAAFVLGSLFFVYRQAIYVPYWDQWGWLERYALHRESFFALTFTPINGHVVAIPGLLYRLDAALFDASNVANLTAMIVCIAATCLLLRAHFAGLADAYRGRTANVFFATTAVLMLWFHNWENLFWPFQVHQYVAVFLSLAALSALSVALAGGSRRVVGLGLAVAVVTGLMASASFGVGLGVWGAAAVILLLGRWPAPWKWSAAALVLCVGLSSGLYLLPMAVYGMPSPDHESVPLEILAFLKFLAQFLGSPMIPGGNTRVLTTDVTLLALATGAGSLGIALACLIGAGMLRLRSRRALSAAELFFVGVMVFALSAGIMAALARGGGGPPWRALSSRYGMFCILFWVSAVPLAAQVFGASTNSIRRLESVVPICLLLLITSSQVRYVEWWMKWRSLVEAATASLVSGVRDPEYLGYLFPADNLQYIDRVTPLLLREKLSPLYARRARFIGHSLREFGNVSGDCDARIVDAKRLSAGYRVSGSLTARGLPFEERPVFVTDEGGRIVGIGTVDRGWWWGIWGGLATEQQRSWTAFAPVDESALNSMRIYVSTERGLCPARGPDGAG